MSEAKKLSDVFKTVGLPPYTYVKPVHFNEVRADISQPGKHLLIEGPSGTGKTCIAFKVFEELNWKQDFDFIYISIRDADAEKKIEQFFDLSGKQTEVYPSIVVIDDFHLLTSSKRAEIGSFLKRLSDKTFEIKNPPKAILIGIPTTGVSLLANAYDLGPRLGTYVFSRASDFEIDQLISEGETSLNILFEDRDVILSESAGNFWLAQYICNKICAAQGVFETASKIKILTFDLLHIRQRLMTELTQRYMPTAKIFSKGKKWRPGGNKPYLEVLLALCKIPESVISFDKVLNVVPERRRPGIKAIRPRIEEIIYDAGKGVDLRKQIAVGPNTVFSIEDPLFRYFLTNLDVKHLYAELGIENDLIEKGRQFSYDVGFSFAGEVRKIVEAINDQLKAEDVITFYDFDLQAFLLAMDLEHTLRRVYSESCRYYLVFLDKNYYEKVWTKFEKDIMTGSGRKEHIIPLILDDEGIKGVLGISATIGRIDLRDLWSNIQSADSISSDIVNALKNRCVLPIIEKIDAANENLI